MQRDLFGSAETGGKSAGKCGNRAALLLPALVTQGSAEDALSLPVGTEKCGTSLSNHRRSRQKQRQEQDKPPPEYQIRDLLAQRLALQIELAEASDVREDAANAYRPYNSAFASAHRVLEKEIADPETTMARRLPLYIARCAASHARGPTKKAFEAAESWERLVLKELKAVNRLIEDIEKKKRTRS